MRQALFIMTLLFTCIALNAQNESKKGNNLVFLEFMGAADQGVGIGYERYFIWNEVSGFSIRTGISHEPRFKDIPVFFGSSLIFGKRHNFEMGMNYMLKDPENFEVENRDFNPNEEWSVENSHYDTVIRRRNIVNFLIGYRYQNERSGVLVRSFIGSKIKRQMRKVGNPGIHFGASFGISF